MCITALPPLLGYNSNFLFAFILFFRRNAVQNLPEFKYSRKKKRKLLEIVVGIIRKV